MSIRRVVLEWKDINCGDVETEILRSIDIQNQTNDSFALIATVSAGKTKYIDSVEDSDSGIGYIYRIRSKRNDIRSGHTQVVINAVSILPPQEFVATIMCGN